MKEIITYVADDGNTFDNKEKCLAYENELKTRFNKFKEKVKAYKFDGTEISFSNEDEFIQKYEEMTFLEIKDEVTSNESFFISDRGYCNIPDSPGLYMYNSSAMDYIPFLDWIPFFDVIKRWYC